MTGISIKHLLGAETGATSVDPFEIAQPMELFDRENDSIVDARSSLSAEAHILRVDGGFEVELHDLQLSLVLDCHTCMRPYDHELYVAKTSAVFFHLPDSEDEGDFAVDVTKARLPLDEWLRQEIIMALPIMQKCHRPDCVVHTPAASKKDDGMIQPFAGLKDLL